MKLQALLKVQLVLLYTQVDGVYLLLHGGHSHLHTTHPPLNGSKGLYDRGIVDLRLRGGTVWEDEAISGNPTGMVEAMGTSSSESSLCS